MDNDMPSKDTPPKARIEKPHAFFSEPHEVVIDPALSKQQKIEALENLEQDARQLMAASDEGMTGGEPNKLHAVLDARESLEKPPSEYAYGVVMHDLRARLYTELPIDDRAAIEKAVEALHAVAHMTAKAVPAPEGVPPPGSKAEMRDEIEREKLDP